MLFQKITHLADEPTLELAKMILRMDKSKDAMHMIRCFVGDDILRHRRLKTKLGNAYGPLVGIYSGYYSLDLSNILDRICLKKLIEKSVQCVEKRRALGKWDTSQHGQWSCFRNEHHHKYQKRGIAEAAAGADPAPEGEGRMITPKYFYPIPQYGKAEFDFVNIERPDPNLCRAAHEDKIIDVSISLSLLLYKHLHLSLVNSVCCLVVYSIKIMSIGLSID